MRRGIPSNRRWAAGPGRWTPAAAGASLASWMRGDDLGASINTTPTPHQYAAIPDRGALGGQYAQATSANQPQVSTLWAPGPAPLFSGNGSLATGTTDAEAWRCLHDSATDVDIYAAIEPLRVEAPHQVILSTFGVSTATAGVTIRISDGALLLHVGNASGSSWGLSGSSAMAFSVGGLHIVRFSKRGASVSASVVGRSEAVSGTIADPADGTDPGHAGMSVGAFAGGSIQPLDGHFFELVVLVGTNLPSPADVTRYLSRWSYAP